MASKGSFRYAKRNTPLAKKRPGSSFVPQGTPPPLGEGGRFRALTAALSQRPGITNPEALAAAIGRKKDGAKTMARLAAKGRARKKA